MGQPDRRHIRTRTFYESCHEWECESFVSGLPRRAAAEESFNIGRNVRFGREDRPVILSIGVEFTNSFNRAQLQNPITGNPFAPLTRNPAGQLHGGLGVINQVFAVGAFPATAAVGAASTGYTGLPRQGALVARITF